MTTLRQISVQQAGQMDLVNELFSAVATAGLFGIDLTGTTGLTLAYYGGFLPVDGVSTTIADGTIALTASQTNYVERTAAGVVSKNTTGWSADKVRLYKVVTSASGITSFEDHRHYAEQPPGLLSKSIAGSGDLTLTSDEARPEIIICTGTLTGNRGLVLPQIKRRWIIVNSTSGAFTLTVKTSSGTGVVVTQGKSAQVMWDGTNTVDVISFLTALALAGLLDLSHASAGQIKFPATQNPSSDPNTLDDYEEGTWTPTFTFVTAGNLSIAYSVQVGSYTKIGREVRVNFVINTSTFTHTTASGSAKVQGFPFTSNTDTNNIHHGSGRWSGITKANYTDISARVDPNTTEALLQASGSAQAASLVVAADMPTAGSVTLHFSLKYPASA